MTQEADFQNAAANWLIRLEGRSSPEDLDEFQKWLDQDSRNEAAFIRLRTAWTHMDRLKLLRPDAGRIDQDLLTSSEADTQLLHPEKAPKANRLILLFKLEELGFANCVRLFSLVCSAATSAFILTWHLLNPLRLRLPLALLGSDALQIPVIVTVSTLAAFFGALVGSQAFHGRDR